MKKEIWKTIKDFPDYMVSNMGNIKSLKFGKEKILTPWKNKDGYLLIKLSKNKKPYTKKIHRLVLETFKPNDDLTKTECNHLDGDKTNNYIENLEWCTHLENIRHAIEIGLINNKGENHYLFGKHPSEETKKKQSEKKKKLFKSGKLNILKGENHPMFGKHPSEETRKKQSEIRKGKYCGENNPSSILTENKVKEIKIDLKEGILTQKQIAEKFGISKTTISDINTGKKWKNVKIL